MKKTMLTFGFVGKGSTMKSDDYGDRMKAYEKVETGRKFMPLLPIYARIDGRSFSKFTKGMERPYDERMSRCMIETTKYLVDQTDAMIGYTQSDEISLAWYSDSVNSQIFFDGKIQKMVSVIAAIASVSFLENYRGMFDLGTLAPTNLPHFDARVFQLPTKIELANTFLWRERDATKNAISMAASSMFSHKDLQHKSGSDMQEMMHLVGTNFNDYPAFFKRGTFVRRELINVHLTQEELKAIPIKHRPTDEHVQRHRMIEMDMPSLVQLPIVLVLFLIKKTQLRIDITLYEFYFIFIK